MSVRYDSLLVQCGIAALVYFVPQDAFILSLAVLNGRAYSNSHSKPVELDNAQDAVSKFYAKKGLSAEAFRVQGQTGKNWQLQFANMYN